MKIKFIQKTTLIDYPGEIACTLFLFGCNFRCGFCYNPELVLGEKREDISEEEVLKFLESRKKYLGAVCITGGEPLLSLTLEFLKKIKLLGYKIKIDTNGSFPEKLKEIIDAKLVDYVAMDIKTDKEGYEKLVRVPVDFKKIEESIKLISSLQDYEFRTTVIQNFHDDKAIEELLKWISGLAGTHTGVSSVEQRKIKKYTLQGFKNHKQFIDEIYLKEKETSEKYVEDLKDIAEKYCEKVILRI